MSFTPYDLEWETEYLPTKTATQYNPGDLIANDATDNVPATSTTGRPLGIIDELKPSTDTSTDDIKVLVPKTINAKMRGNVGTGTLTKAMIGRRVDLKDADEVDVNASSVDPLIVAGFISATEGVFKINQAI